MKTSRLKPIALALAITLFGPSMPAFALRAVGLEEAEETRTKVVAALTGAPTPSLPVRAGTWEESADITRHPQYAAYLTQRNEAEHKIEIIHVAAFEALQRDDLATAIKNFAAAKTRWYNYAYWVLDAHHPLSNILMDFSKMAENGLRLAIYPPTAGLEEGVDPATAAEQLTALTWRIQGDILIYLNPHFDFPKAWLQDSTLTSWWPAPGNSPLLLHFPDESGVVPQCIQWLGSRPPGARFQWRRDVPRPGNLQLTLAFLPVERTYPGNITPDRLTAFFAAVNQEETPLHRRVNPLISQSGMTITRAQVYGLLGAADEQLSPAQANVLAASHQLARSIAIAVAEQDARADARATAASHVITSENVLRVFARDFHDEGIEGATTYRAAEAFVRRALDLMQLSTAGLEERTLSSLADLLLSGSYEAELRRVQSSGSDLSESKRVSAAVQGERTSDYPSGSWLAIAHGDGVVRLWNLFGVRNILREFKRELNDEEARQFPITALMFRGSYLLCAGDVRGHLYEWIVGTDERFAWPSLPRGITALTEGPRDSLLSGTDNGIVTYHWTQHAEFEGDAGAGPRNTPVGQLQTQSAVQHLLLAWDGQSVTAVGRDGTVATWLLPFAAPKEGIEFYATMVAAKTAYYGVAEIEEELAAAGHTLEAMLAIPVQHETVIYAMSEAMRNPLIVALQEEAAKTPGFQHLRIQERWHGAALPTKAILLVGAGERTEYLRAYRRLNREDITVIEIQSARSLNQLFKLILEAKLGHEVGGLVIRRNGDLRTTYIFA